MSYNSSKSKMITSPETVVEQNYRVTANYFMSIVLKGEVLEICFPVSSESTIACFKIRGFVSEDDFNGVGWIENFSRERNVKLIVPPRRPGLFIGTTVQKRIEVEAYSKIFWEISRNVRAIKTSWSDTPAYFFHAGNSLPSISFNSSNNGTFLGIGDSPDNATLTAVHLSRVGERDLEKETTGFLEKFSEVKDKIVRDNIFMSIFNSNSDFVDREDSCLMASKSPKYYVSGGFWARDFIFWTLPILERYDPERAKSMLSLLLTKYWKHKGIHSLYLDGRVLYDGFELDQFSYYFIALERAIIYKIITPEESIVRANELMDVLATRKSDLFNLFSTDLNSSDDPVNYPYVTFDNVVLWYSVKSYGERIKNLLLEKSYLEYAEKVRRDVMKALVNEDMFCYSSDLNGNFEMYDDPTGSLILLPYLGFIERDSKIFLNTLNWIRSDRNEFKIAGKFGGLGNRHVKHPWVHSFATLMLSRVEDISIMKNAPMDDGLACETIDEENGKCLTGIHFPGASAFLVQALLARSQEDRIGKA